MALWMGNVTVQSQSLLNQAKKQGASSKTRPASEAQSKKTTTTNTKKNTASVAPSAKPKTTTSNAAKPKNRFAPEAQPKTASKSSASSGATTQSYVNIGKGDLPLFDLHGPVKSVKMSADFGKGTFNFDRNGRWTTWDGEPISAFAVTRDKNGRVDYFADGFSNSFSYASNGLFRRYTVTTTQCEYSYTYSYNASGDMTNCTISSNCSSGKSSENMNFAILQRDAYGNWLKRKTGNTTETRTIEFYDTSANNTTYSNTDKVYDVVDRMPSFPGGMGALMNFLSANIKYPVYAEEYGIQGRVICTFIVEKDGSISDIRVTRSIHKTLDDEAVRVLSTMPKWIPGQAKGQVCRVRFTLPVTFKLQ